MNRPNLVLLHGWGLNSAIFQPIVPLLSQYFQISLIDLPGFDARYLSDSSYDLNTVAETVLAAAPESAIWLGWSLGGLIATYIATKYPYKVQKLINVTSSPKFLKEDQWPGIERHLLHKISDDLTKNYEATLNRFLMMQFYGLENSKSLLQMVNQQLHGAEKPSIAALKGGLHLLEAVDLRKSLANLSMPIFYIFGRLDLIVPVQIAAELKLIQPSAKTAIMMKASHIPFISHPDEFIDLLNEFCFT